jgi:uncharacterized protein (TIGR03083 family)
VEPSQHLSVLEASASRLLGVAKGAFDRPVPSCPDWAVSDLVAHVGGVWGWAAATVEQGGQAARPAPPERPDEPALLSWAQGQGTRLLTALRAADPDSSCWTFGPPPTRRFWFRRQALETALHAWDAEGSTAGPGHLDGEVAADGVDEFLYVGLPRWAGRNPGVWHGESVHLHRTDGEGEWLVRLGPGGLVHAERAHAKGDLAVRGSAEGLWLWCTNRGAAERLGLEVLGDLSMAERWSAEISF